LVYVLKIKCPVTGIAKIERNLSVAKALPTLLIIIGPVDNRASKGFQRIVMKP
jgi:hypothetical protein